MSDRRWSTDLPLLDTHERAIVLERCIQAEGRYIVQTSGPGVFAGVRATFEPLETPGRVALLVPADLEFVHSPVPDGHTLARMMTALYEGLITRARRHESTWLGGIHVRVDALDYHPVDSRPRDYRIAIERALDHALAEAGRDALLRVEQRLSVTPALAGRLDQLARQLGAEVVARSHQHDHTSVTWRIERSAHTAALDALARLEGIEVGQHRVVIEPRDSRG